MCKKTYFSFLISSLILFASCSKKQFYKHSEGYTIGTFYSIKYISPKDTLYSIDKLMESINKSVSLYDENSVISRINRNEHYVKADRHFKSIFAESKQIHKKTNGWFEPTVGALVEAWGFSVAKDNDSIIVPDLEKLLPSVNLNNINIISDEIIKKDPLTKLDFNSIGKGYAVDQVGEMLERNGVNNYLVEIGGEIRCRGNSLSGKPWVIGIEDPRQSSTDRVVKKIITLCDKSIASSGNYRKFKIKADGKKYVHTVNPKTGMAVENNILSASVIHQKCITADAYATAFMAMGFDNARKILSQDESIDAYFIYIDQNGQEQEFYTERLKEFFDK